MNITSLQGLTKFHYSLVKECDVGICGYGCVGVTQKANSLLDEKQPAFPGPAFEPGKTSWVTTGAHLSLLAYNHRHLAQESRIKEGI
ncbi:hypothetical protein SERLADRAFT_455325 [Serpula lacrymans var. lacrymans S7.9]|uniref:Uncharacterized protein n=1 Tax=Serpula lacrymans var. lacrymans (strain S7.9) TaxID=578457 RepID=F8NFX4_SERL9|nr:uncharacterized protein SERLADRAFT_455325 [Serpula lacrymans var. lacrymans S7.9]EGO30944.1 hypothetical protein SERLADRAFT_455325 [Serpula lacrymans var. lacrymans S7.9]